MNIYTVPYFNQNIVLNPYTQNTALPVSGCLGNIVYGNNIVGETTLTINPYAISSINLTTGVWIIVGYSTTDCVGIPISNTVLSITDQSYNIILNYSVSNTSSVILITTTYTCSVTGIIPVTSATTYYLSASSISSFGEKIVGTLTTFIATRIA